MKALGCLIMLAVLAAFAHPAHASNGLCRWEGGAGTDRSCLPEDCTADGGTALCSQVEIKKPDRGNNPEGYTYGMCDGSLYTSNDVKWCVAAGGTPGTGPDGGAGCDNLPPHVLGNMGQSTDLESLTYSIPDKKVGNPTCDKTNAVDSGWGKTPEHDPGCWPFNPSSVNGINVSDRRERTYSGHVKDANGVCNTPWSETIVVRRDRAVQCPIGYAQRMRADGRTDCYRPAPCCKKVGDPIEASSGGRIMREEDYRFAVPGGLELTRFYYSYGFYRPADVSTSATPANDDYWRTNYDIRVYAETVAGQPSASVVYPDGRVAAFDATGRALQAYDGGYSVLTRSSDGWVLSEADGGRKTFDTDGRLTAIIDAKGLQTLVAYDANHRIGMVEDPLGRTLVFIYDGDHLASITTPDGKAITLAYDDGGNVASVTYADGTSRQYQYTDQRFRHALTSLTDQLGHTSTFAYDSLGRAWQNTLPGGAVETVSYGSSGATFTSASGAIQTMQFAGFGGVMRPTSTTISCAGCTTKALGRTYDDSGNILSFKDSTGSLTRFTYDPVTNLETTRAEALKADGTDSPATRRTASTWNVALRKPLRIVHSAVSEDDWAEVFEYDDKGNQVASAETSGQLSRRTTYAYDADGRVTKIDGPRVDVADITTLTYFADDDPCVGCRGQLKTMTNALGQVTSYESYDANGNLLVVRDANGLVSKSQYDQRGRLVSSVAGDGTALEERTSSTYDLAGRIVATTAPDGSTATYTYDAEGRVIEASTGDGSSMRLARDPSGYVLDRALYSAGGALAHSEGSVVDPTGELLASIDAYGHRTNYQYDVGGHRIGSITPLGFLVKAGFDELGRTVLTSLPAGGDTRASYNSRDQVVAYTDSNGYVTSYAYDGLGNVISVTSPDKGTSTLGYDEAGNLIESTDARGIRTTYTYDALNRVVEKVDGAGRSDAVTTHSVYDVAPNGVGLLASVVRGQTEVSYEYDTLGRVASETQRVGTGTANTVRYLYGDGHLLKMTYPSGMVVEYTYDANGRISNVAADATSVLGNAVFGPFGRLESYDGAPGQVIHRAYDLNGRLSSVTLGPVTSLAGTSVYDYDANNRLTQATTEDGHVLAYTYDFNGNRVSSKRDGVEKLYAHELSSNRLVSIGDATGGSTETYVHDLAGNVTNHASWVYTYDVSGKLASAAGAGSAVYSVDGFGRRVEAASGSDRVSYVYGEDDRVIGHYAPDARSNYETIYASGIPVAVVLNGGQSSMQAFVAYSDQLGAIRSLADRSGSVAWSWKGDPFGSAEPTSPDGSYRVNFAGRFPGQELDDTTGLFYNLNRDYDPATGRYLQSDPIGTRGGPNTYAYVENNPVTRIDPTGLKWIASRRHDGYSPTIECDGMGGIRVFLGTMYDAKQLACMKDCIVIHEKSHLEDAAYDSPCYLKDAGIQVYNPDPRLTDDSEIKAYKKSLGCLRSKLAIEKAKQCPECEGTLNAEIAKQEDLLSRYEGDYVRRTNK